MIESYSWWAGLDLNQQRLLRHGFTDRLLHQFAYLPSFLRKLPTSIGGGLPTHHVIGQVLSLVENPCLKICPDINICFIGVTLKEVAKPAHLSSYNGGTG